MDKKGALQVSREDHLELQLAESRCQLAQWDYRAICSRIKAEYEIRDSESVDIKTGVITREQQQS